jgi:hypothetical protein
MRRKEGARRNKWNDRYVKGKQESKSPSGMLIVAQPKTAANKKKKCFKSKISIHLFSHILFLCGFDS